MMPICENCSGLMRDCAMWGQVFLEGRALASLPCLADKGTRVPGGYKAAVADQAGIARLFSKYRDPLIGIATGCINCIDVVDIDPRHGGDRFFHENRDRLPQTRTHTTQHDGWHLIYRHVPGLRTSCGRIAPGVDIRAGGPYIIWWPAHGCRVLCEGPVADFPRWLLDGLVSAPRNAEQQIAKWPLQMGKAGELPKPLYFEVLRLVPLSATVTRRHRRWVMSILNTVTQLHEGRNDALNVAAFRLRELIEAGVLSRDAAEQLLFMAAQACGYVAKDGDRAAMATIRSGLGSAIGGPCGV